MEHSLIVSFDNKTIFKSDAHWLHPLFELNDFLQENPYPAGQLFLRDKVAGKAAACMMAYIGIRKCHIELISERAIPIYRAAEIDFTYDHLVEHIDCRTEDLITDDMGIEDTWLFLRKRAGRVSGLSIAIKGLSIRREGMTIIDKLNLDVAAGERLVVQGDNGAGKTTLLKTMLGLIKPDEGSVKIGTYTVGSAEWKYNRMNTAYVHQENIKNTFPISADEVVAIGLAGKKTSASETAYQVEIAMRRTGCFHLLKRSYHSLSGGEKQRVSLARCICQHAKVLLFDEPTSFLDERGRDDLTSMLNELSQHEAPTIIAVSHDKAWTQQLTWEKLEMKGGRIC